jgi:hypothetical protein
MLTCLAQIVVLLRQLLRTQHDQSSVARILLVCIGWQAVLDVLLCLGHIYFSLGTVDPGSNSIFCSDSSIIIRAKSSGVPVMQGNEEPNLNIYRIIIVHTLF